MQTQPPSIHSSLFIPKTKTLVEGIPVARSERRSGSNLKTFTRVNLSGEQRANPLRVRATYSVAREYGGGAELRL